MIHVNFFNIFDVYQRNDWPDPAIFAFLLLLVDIFSPQKVPDVVVVLFEN